MKESDFRRTNDDYRRVNAKRLLALAGELEHLFAYELSGCCLDNEPEQQKVAIKAIQHLFDCGYLNMLEGTAHGPGNRK